MFQLEYRVQRLRSVSQKAAYSPSSETVTVIEPVVEMQAEKPGEGSAGAEPCRQSGLCVCSRSAVSDFLLLYGL